MDEIEISNLLKYIWGKVPKKRRRPLVYHPLVCHLIDVAAVAEIYWEDVFSKYLKTQVGHLFQNQETTKRWLMFLAGLHDLGKSTPIFQSQVPELAEKLKRYGLETYNIKIYHSILSGEIFYRHLKSGELGFRIEDKFISKLRYVIGGHHGIFQSVGSFREIENEHIGCGNWKDVQKKLIQIVADFCGFDHDNRIVPFYSEEVLNSDKFNTLYVFIAGFISVVDWIGSNDEFFNFYSEYENITEFKENYFKLSRKRAKEAIKKIGWDSWKVPDGRNEVFPFKKVFQFINDLRPLQQQIIDNLKHITSPSLVIIEAPMGEGKTEAALYLEHYLEQNENLQGAYIALPTQATADQMFLRVKDFLSKVKPRLRVNLHLLHGTAILSDKYSILKTNSKNFDKEESNIVADEWFTFRKRGLISPFGVGTIDQILLSVLPLKHFFIRLFGLAGKVIIIDEVHSYDVYMDTILTFLLKWLNLLGSSVILLSATLPSFKRKTLIKTYYSKNDEIRIVNYPRITMCSKDKIIIRTFNVELKKQGDKSVFIGWIDENSILEKLKTFLKNGGRVAIVCNKVKRAQNLYLKLKRLKDLGFEVDLLHSRFPYIQKKGIIDAVLEKYGKNKNIKTFSRLLISTQIIEQSLDLDFDLMISDLAPIDFLFQRMGRLHRHVKDKEGNIVVRPDMLKRPQFWVIKPELNEHSIPQFSNPIYSNYILLKTFLHLWQVDNISIPDDLESKIESVYGDNSGIPAIFDYVDQWEREISQAKIKKENSDRDKSFSAENKLILNPSEEAFFEDFPDYFEDIESLQLSTRLTSPSIRFFHFFYFLLK